MYMRERLLMLKKQGFRMAVIAREAGISKSMINYYVTGKKNCSPETLKRIEEALEKIFGGTQ